MATAQSSAGAPRVATAPGTTRTTTYEAAFFAQYAPRTALDIVRRIPGFTLDLGNTELRGFSGAAGNVVIDGQRQSSKSETLEVLLGRIPASRVASVAVGPGDLYGADFSGKAQVANLILSQGGGLAGTVSSSVTRHWFGRIVPTGSASIQLSRGLSTFNISGDAARGDQFEIGFDEVTDPATGELVERRDKRNYVYDRDPYVSASWALEQGDDRSMHLNARFERSRFRLRQTNRVTPTGEPLRDDALHQNYKNDIFELGGDVARPLAGGTIKLVGLATRRKRSTFDDYLFRGEGSTPILGGFEQFSESRLGETIGKLSWSHGDLAGFSFETGAEVAYNKLDYALDLFAIEAGGERTPIDLPLEDATVSELRSEFYVNGGRQLSETLRLDASLNFEVSSLKVRGDATADRALKFLKPGITLDWQPGGGWRTQFILRRTVAQLDFYDFVSVAELSNDRVSGGNANLVPQRSWEARAVAERPVLGAGKARLELGYDLVSQLQDRILVFDEEGNAFDAPGNLGSGRRFFADLTLDAPLDRLWQGLRLRANGRLQRTRVEDPISGQMRNFSDYFPDWEWSVDVRRDAGRFAYGLAIQQRDDFYLFRTDQIDAFVNQRPFATAFVEYRPSKASSITFTAENLLDGGGFVERVFYFPNRTDPEPDFDETRFRNSHVRLNLAYKLSFGGSGVAKPS